MVAVRNIREFALKNEEHLKRFFKYKTGIYDPDLIKEHIQEFYVKLIQTEALKKFDEEKGNFDSYISTLLCWLMPILAHKNFRVRFAVVSYVLVRRDKLHEEYDDIWNHVYGNSDFFKPDNMYLYSSIQDEDEERTTHSYFEDFKDFIQRTESKQQANQMTVFLDQKQAGCNSADIAVMLNISRNMVKIIKQKIKRKFRTWQQITRVK